MLPINITRFQSQLLSMFFMMVGVLIIFFTNYFSLGVIIVFMATWIILMSESILLAKVQNEMQIALEDLSRKKEKQVEDILFFLKQSSISASPFKSIDGAKQLCERMVAPSMVLTPNHQIVKANHAMHVVLGWTCPSLDGVHAHTINDPLMMSKIGEWAANPKNATKESITSYYVYNKKNGEAISGLMHASKIDVQGFFVTFYPSSEHAFSYDDIKEIIINKKLQI